MINPTTEQLETEIYQGTLEQRIAALGQLCAQLGPRSHRGTNGHIHTSESFSVFRSPTEAVWQAAREGLAVLGINDHYTVAGHEEFRRACAVAGIAATFSLEAVAMAREAAESGLKLNDPDNPYWGRDEGAEDSRRKPAYHNGTAWVWLLPSFCEALVRAWDFQPEAVAAARAYLGSLDRLLAEGCVGQLPEILDGDAPHAQRGCDAQAWSVTEALRVWRLLETAG